MMIELNLHRN